MRTVRDESGTRYLLLKESSDASLVRDPETGAERHVPNDDLEPIEGESPLSTAASAVPDAVRTVVTAAHDDRALGLLVELDARGPLSVQQLLDSYDLCESDLHGLLGEFRAAGLLEEATVAGQRGYDVTETASEAVASLTGRE
ncbi:DUF7346 family protein [Haloarcula nitratireducens]|uniref:HTH domain protein n=1 Tax=Haloarcula nitratireducens TaxID=2487749 RepID=A0AAW4P7C1_9EURY|nr:hypothetical protein [Halomicroarcula nitratireducens]MBX0293480.1 hypothetical protein [Halomicroarcula nitratireducens]